MPAKDPDLQAHGCSGAADPAPEKRPYRIAWARLIARVFQEDVLECPRCQTPGMQMIAFITQPHAIRKILDSVGLPADSPEPSPARSPEDLFNEPTAA